MHFSLNICGIFYLLIDDVGHWYVRLIGGAISIGLLKLHIVEVLIVIWVLIL